MVLFKVKYPAAELLGISGRFYKYQLYDHGAILYNPI
jgi:hypothetical protein